MPECLFLMQVALRAPILSRFLSPINSAQVAQQLISVTHKTQEAQKAVEEIEQVQKVNHVTSRRRSRLQRKRNQCRACETETAEAGYQVRKRQMRGVRYFEDVSKFNQGKRNQCKREICFEDIPDVTSTFRECGTWSWQWCGGAG